MHTWAEQSATTWLSGEMFNVSFCCQPPWHRGTPSALIKDTAWSSSLQHTVRRLMLLAMWKLNEQEKSFFYSLDHFKLFVGCSSNRLYHMNKNCCFICINEWPLCFIKCKQTKDLFYIKWSVFWPPNPAMQPTMLIDSIDKTPSFSTKNAPVFTRHMKQYLK